MQCCHLTICHLALQARFDNTSQKKKRSRKDGDPEDSLAYGLQASRGHPTEDLTNRSRVVGKSTSLEKAYFRLTTFPKSDEVRPEKVLKKALAHIKSRFIKTEDFGWANEQLKSVRQDLTVQGLRNKFVVEVYETHARILLEHGDLNEFHQCQTMIRTLTSRTGVLENELGSDEYGGHAYGEQLQQTPEATDEFHAYGALYNLIQNAWSELAWSLALGNESAVSFLSAASIDVDDPAFLHGSSFRHTLQVVKAVLHDDYHCFFRLYENAPHLSAYLMDFLVNRVRVRAYERIIAAYRPTVSVEHFRGTLVFDTLDETRRFLKDKGAVFINGEQGKPPFWLDCKASFALL